MTRKKVKIAWIPSDTARRASFRKRKGGLVKKMEELNILCDVHSVLILYAPGELEPTIWPSRKVAEELLERFTSMSDWERCRKMVSQENYLRERIAKSQQLMAKHRRRNRELQASHFMNQLWSVSKRLDDFGLEELLELVWLVEEKRTEITKRRDLSQCITGSPPPASAHDDLLIPPSCPDTETYLPQLGFPREKDESYAPPFVPGSDSPGKETCLLPMSSLAMECLLPPGSRVETGTGLVVDCQNGTMWDKWISDIMNETQTQTAEDAACSKTNEMGVDPVYPIVSGAEPDMTLLAKGIGNATGAAPGMVGIVEGMDSSLGPQNGDHLGGVNSPANMNMDQLWQGARGTPVENLPGNRSDCCFTLQDGHIGGGNSIQLHRQVATADQSRAGYGTVLPRLDLGDENDLLSPMIMMQFNDMEGGKRSSGSGSNASGGGPITNPAMLNRHQWFFP